MNRFSRSEVYGLGAVLALLLMVLLDNAWIMLVVSAVGFGVGLWVVRGGEVKRTVWLAVVAFAVSLALALFALLR